MCSSFYFSTLDIGNFPFSSFFGEFCSDFPKLKGIAVFFVIEGNEDLRGVTSVCKNVHLVDVEVLCVFCYGCQDISLYAPLLGSGEASNRAINVFLLNV